MCAITQFWLILYTNIQFIDLQQTIVNSMKCTIDNFSIRKGTYGNHELGFIG